MRHCAIVKRCSHEGCTNHVVNGGVCTSHEGCTNYYVVEGEVCVRHGDGAKLTSAKVRTCNNEGCTNKKTIH